MGAGAHGEFFAARPPARLGLDAELVAVKVLAGPTNDDALRRATRELRIFATVESPYLVKLYDAGQDRGRFYYSMEYATLGSLAAPVEPLTRTDVLHAVSRACRAAHALHEAGVVHRSIKPSNILLFDAGAKLSDLGLAQAITPGLSMTGLGPVGAVEYIDPAVLRGGASSRGSDIWSLATSLHRALTGIGVYGDLGDAESLLAVRKVLSQPPVLSPDLSPTEARIVGRCLMPDAAERPPTAAVVADELDVIAGAH
jgi:serine/threonine protein kinase